MSKFKCGFKEAYIKALGTTKSYDTDYNNGEKVIDRKIIDSLHASRCLSQERNFDNLNSAEKFVCKYITSILSIAEKIILNPSIPYLLHDKEYEMDENQMSINLYDVITGIKRYNFDLEDSQIISNIMSAVFDNLDTIDKSTYYAVLCSIYYIQILRGDDAKYFEEKYISLESDNNALTNLPLVKNALYLKNTCEKLNVYQDTITKNIEEKFKVNPFFIAAQKSIDIAKELNSNSLGFFELDTNDINMYLNDGNVSIKTFEGYHKLNLSYEFGTKVWIDYNNPDRLFASEVMPFAFQEDCDQNMNYEFAFKAVQVFNEMIKNCRLINEAPIVTKLTDVPGLLEDESPGEIYLSLDEYINDIKRYEMLALNSVQTMSELIYKSVLEMLAHYE